MVFTWAISVEPEDENEVGSLKNGERAIGFCKYTEFSWGPFLKRKREMDSV